MLANASHVNHNLVDHRREWLSSALDMVQRLLSSSPIVKGADLAYNQEEGVPNDSSVSKHQRARISGAGKSFIPLTYSKKAVFLPLCSSEHLTHYHLAINYS